MTEPILQRELESGLSQPASAEAVERVIVEVRSTGVANTRGIFVQGFAAVAAPVFDADGQPVLVMGLIAQIVDLPEVAVPQVEAELLAATQAPSRQLGFAPAGPRQTREEISSP